MSWYLDDLNGTIDVQEDESGVTQVRYHTTIQIHQKVEANTVLSTLDLGQTQAAIQYNVGNVIRTNNPVGAGKFICVGDGLVPVEHPSSMVIRRQTWEHFSAWTTAPTEWNQ